MKKYIILSIMTTMSFILNGQVLSNQPVSNQLQNENAFLDASTNFSTEFNDVDNNIGKGLVFPTVDLTAFEFRLENIDGFGIFPTFFNGMIVYNRTTGKTLTTGNRSSTATDVEPGFYYYYNPTGRDLFNISYDVAEAVKAGEWKPFGGGNNKLSIKQVTIPVQNGTFDTKNLIFYGKTTTATGTLKVISIEPIFSDLTMRRNFLKVDADVQVTSNAADWTVHIENRNISSAIQCTLQSVIISYICDDVAALADNTQGYTEIIGY